MTNGATRHRLVDEANKRLQLSVPEFALTDRKIIIERLLDEPELVEYFESAAGQGASADDLRERAREYAAEIGPKFRAFFYFRLGRFLARTLIRIHYRVRTVLVDAKALAAISTDSTVILVSNHRSNFDPLVITYVASGRSTIALSAGEWARLWPFHHLVRAAGGFVVDRDAGDPLYRRVLATYVRMSAANGLHQAIFPEGELTRDGFMGPPKLGFLNFYCRGLSDVRDIVFIPVGINYDRIPEDRRLVFAEGRFDKPQAGFLIASSLRYVAAVLALPFRRRSRRFGNACVAIGAPVSLRQWLTQKDVDTTDIEKPQRLPWLATLADELMQSSAVLIPAPPVPLTAAVICAEPGKLNWSVAELRIGVQDLIRQLQAKGANVHAPEGADAATDAAVDLMTHNRLIRRDSGGNISAVDSELPVLRYYANSILPIIS